ncbi:MAG: hypothetical protein KF799_15245 [Bdellovibrionales bacterium]|nr:hypothetical protein [Bdellovibrionales bacterium]
MPEETTSTSTRQSRTNGKWQKAQQASQGVETGSESVKTAFDTVSEKASQYMDQASELFGSIDFKSIGSSPGRMIRQYPVQAAIGGAVIGFLLGAAVCRRSAE